MSIIEWVPLKYHNLVKTSGNKIYFCVTWPEVSNLVLKSEDPMWLELIFIAIQHAWPPTCGKCKGQAGQTK